MPKLSKISALFCSSHFFSICIDCCSKFSTTNSWNLTRKITRNKGKPERSKKWRKTAARLNYFLVYILIHILLHSILLYSRSLEKLEQSRERNKSKFYSGNMYRIVRGNTWMIICTKRRTRENFNSTRRDHQTESSGKCI